MNSVVYRDIRVQKPGTVRQGFTEEVIFKIRAEGGCNSSEGNKKKVGYIWETTRQFVLLLDSLSVLCSTKVLQTVFPGLPRELASD